MKIAIGLYICLLFAGNVIGMVLMGLMVASGRKSRCEECREKSRR